MALTLSRDVKGNKKDSFKYMSDKRKTRENVGPLLNEMGDLVTQDMEKAEELNAAFALVLTSQTGLQESRIPETRGKGWSKEYVPLVEEDQKGKKEDPENQRRVTLIPGKVMEKLILETISRHMNNKKIIRISRHGFTKGKSCMTNLINFYDEMTVLVDKWRAVDIVYLNFRKAFDTVSHKILIEKLLMHGLDDQTVRLIENWLSGWAQTVVISSPKSNWRTLTSGVLLSAQGGCGVSIL
ncbi:hypothetical protein QYF61_015433 [Mycteria americana]|uniref:Reverse transcriptase domain-containing protein n=1 Tax=Mycteria americana TaxID=33587 RepID=A0AAN7PIK4_MYCAM|nr:hypothetical protein QYF61_015433 [Mycteria americana]